MTNRDIALHQFIVESNMIENIHRAPLKREIDAHNEFLEQDVVTVSALERFVGEIQPDIGVLRREHGMNVRVGSHIAPFGGWQIEQSLQEILDSYDSPWMRHVRYETLHPFMDGNGRSGRVLWLHDMGGIERVPLGFLHTFYYQTLQNSGTR